MNTGSPAVSVVVPLFNEEENVPILQGELTSALGGIDYESLDHAARDHAVKRLEAALRSMDERIRVY